MKYLLFWLKTKIKYFGCKQMSPKFVIAFEKMCFGPGSEIRIEKKFHDPDPLKTNPDLQH